MKIKTNPLTISGKDTNLSKYVSNSSSLIAACSYKPTAYNILIIFEQHFNQNIWEKMVIIKCYRYINENKCSYITFLLIRIE